VLRLLCAALPLFVSGAAFPAPAPAEPSRDISSSGAFPDSSPDSSSYVEALISHAHALHLAEQPQWLSLGYWRHEPLTGYQSAALGPDFFLAKDGATNPQAELDATLRGIFGLIPLSAEQRAREVDPATCRFPARAIVLQQWLHFDPRTLPRSPCPKFETYWRKVQPEAVSIIFSAYYLNNPASAFGHTFLRIRKREPYVTSEKRELLDSSVDYSADVDTANPIAYALKGLFGLFPGTFKLRPYYYKVREYNDYESRDIWEYELNLTDAQVVLLAAHLFELGSAIIPYYYIGGNCSYYILAAVQAVAPELHLLEQVGIPVVPADTIKALYANPGLVRAVRFRPSASKQFAARVEHMPSAERDMVESLAANADADIPPIYPDSERIRILDAAADLVDIRYAKELPFVPDGEGGRIKQRILERRAQILAPSEQLLVPQPATMPQESHGSARLSAGFVDSDINGPALSLGYRMALHALDDPLGGYPDLAQIEFFPAEVRVDGQTGVVHLERADFISALSLHEMTSFDQRLSWKLRAGSERIYDAGCRGCLAALGNVGSGASALLGPLTLFATADATVQASAALQGIDGARALRVLLGPAGGARLRLGDEVTLLATGRYDWMPRALGTWTWELEASLRWAPVRDLALGISARKFPDERELGGQLYYYY